MTTHPDTSSEGVAYATQLEAFTTVNANLKHSTDQHREARDALNWIQERLCSTQDRLDFEKRDHEVTKGYRQHAEQELTRLRTQLAAERERADSLQRELDSADKLIRAYSKESRE